MINEPDALKFIDSRYNNVQHQMSVYNKIYFRRTTLKCAYPTKNSGPIFNNNAIMA